MRFKFTNYLVLAKEVIAMTRNEMIHVLTALRSDVPESFWTMFDDTALTVQVALVQKQIEDQSADELAMN